MTRHKANQQRSSPCASRKTIFEHEIKSATWNGYCGFLRRNSECGVHWHPHALEATIDPNPIRRYWKWLYTLFSGKIKRGPEMIKVSFTSSLMEEFWTVNGSVNINRSGDNIACNCESFLRSSQYSQFPDLHLIGRNDKINGTQFEIRMSWKFIFQMRHRLRRHPKSIGSKHAAKYFISQHFLINVNGLPPINRNVRISLTCPPYRAHSNTNTSNVYV